MGFKTKLAINIINIARMNRDIYENWIRNAMNQHNNNIEEINYEEATLARSAYLKKVYYDVKNFYSKDKKIQKGILEIEQNPALIDRDELNLEEGFLGGSIFEIIYYAKKKRNAKPGECILLNHKTNDIMNEVLETIESCIIINDNN